MQKATFTYLRAACRRCMRSGRAFLGRYREFMTEPATLFTLGSLLLLIAAGIQSPAGLLGSDDPSRASTGLYLAAALVGSAYIWWSAFQGIRVGDFTADIPVSLATLAALAIGQYSAAAVVAVLLLLGGAMEGFVAARSNKALEALATLLPTASPCGARGKTCPSLWPSYKWATFCSSVLGSALP